MRSTLEPGQSLLQGEELTSSNGAYYAPLQHDGNFVVYRKAGNVARWSTQTKDGVRLTMQTDGNLVLYNNKTGRPTWDSKTVSGAANHWAAMDSLGRFSVIEPETLGAPFMTPNPASEGASLAIQDDGNLVVYSTKGEPLWASNTHGK